METVAEIHSTDIGVIAEETLGRRIDIAVDRGPHEAEPALPVAVILRQPQHAVVRERLDGGAALGRALGDPLNGTDREPTGQAARDLRGTQDARGIVADPPRVEQPFTATVHDVAVHTEIEDARSFHEERAPLLIERLEGREIDDRRVRLDLAEVGVYGRIDGDVRSDAVFDVRTPIILLVALESRGRQVLGDRVRGDFQPPRCRETIETDDVTELRNEAAARDSVQRPTDALAAVPVDAAPDREAKRVTGGLRFRRKAGCRVFGRLKLREVLVAWSESPALVVVLPVDGGRGRRRGRNGGGGRGSAGGGGGRGGCRNGL